MRFERCITQRKKPKSERTRIQKKEHICPTCSKSFRHAYDLKRHARVHTGETPFRCPLRGCGRRFSLRGNCKVHIARCLKSKTLVEAEGSQLSVQVVDEEGHVKLAHIQDVKPIAAMPLPSEDLHRYLTKEQGERGEKQRVRPRRTGLGSFAVSTGFAPEGVSPGLKEALASCSTTFTLSAWI